MSEKLPDAVPEQPSTGTTRRELFEIGQMFALPVLLGGSQAAMAAPGPLKPGPEIYQSIGVEPIINCRGTFTIIGGSCELPEVRAAMDAASKYYVQIDELALGVGQRLAEITGAEWGMVSAGCAAGMKHVTAACVTGGNPEKLVRIPDLSGLEKTEVIIPRSSRNVYDHAVRNIGVRVIMVDTPEELAGAINNRTAMIYMTSGGQGPMSVENVAKIAKPKNIPILVDAAAEILTIPNVHLQRGATIVAYSGGKAIRGPQCAGLLIGQKDILMSAWQASAPHHGPGRDNKVGREEMCGMLAAVEAWVKRDHQAEWKTWLTWLDNISKRVTAIDGVKTSVREPTGLGNRSPGLTITWDPAKLHITGEEVGDYLATTKPRIALGGGGGGGARGARGGAAAAAAPVGTSVSITAWMMQPGDDKVVADRLYAVLSQKRSPKVTEAPKAPAGNITGRWNVEVDFFSSKSQHLMFVEQNGNKLQGSYKSDFHSRDLSGTIEGNEVKFRSTQSERTPGDNVNFTFGGNLSGDSISGTVYMGEYMTAKFTAKRHAYPANGGGGRVVIPNGPPLSS